MNQVLHVVYSGSPGPAETALSKLARFSGIAADFVDFKTLSAASFSTSSCLALTAQTLSDIDSFAMLPLFKRLVGQAISHLLITTDGTCSAISQTLQAFTDGRVVSVLPAMGKMRPYVVSRRFRTITGPLTGLSFAPVADTDSVFQLGDGHTDSDEIISIGGSGHFIKVPLGACGVYLLGSAVPLDIDVPVSESPWIAGCFSSLFPVLMFIRQAFGNRCWHSACSRATLTIDDPLLADRYGFVRYQELLQFMDRYSFFTTIGFIPWNFRRTSPSVARLLKKRKDRISICVHGCDHTRHELAASDYGELNGRIKLATIRMTEHQRLTGIPFDKVMVFPQGAFSSSCMEVLKTNNYLAAVNLETTPVHAFEAVPLRTFLEPAITCFGNFPLFGRRYPEDISDLALDLFLYKPALILEHHDFFRQRSLAAMHTIRRINGLDPTMRWSRLEAVVARSFLQRQEGEDTVFVKAFGRKTSISNDSDSQKQYIFLKEEKDSRAIEKVLINGRERPYDLENSFLILSLPINRGSTVMIEIVYRDAFPNTQVADSFYQNIRVFSRRHLSGIRDNYLSRNRTVLALANRMKSLIE